MPTRLWRNELFVNTTAPGNQDQSAVCALADGGFVIAWRDDGPLDSIIRWQRYDAAGLKVGTELASTTFINPGLDQSAPALVQLANGQLWITQQDVDSGADQDIEGFTVALDGSSFTQRSPANQLSETEIDPAVASLGASGSVAVWVIDSFGAGDIRMRGFDAAGNITFGATAGGVAVNDNSGGSLAAQQLAPAVAATRDGSKFIVTWQDTGLNSGDIRGRVFDAGGNALFPEFTVNGGPFENQQAPAVAWLDNNRFVAVWHAFNEAGDNSTTGIRFAIKAADGSFISSDTLVNTTTHDAQLNPVIAVLPSGGFVIAWKDGSNSEPDTTSAIRLQAFDTNGNRTGGEILVNSTTNSDQDQPALTALSDGRVVVTWRDFSTSAGGNGTSIRAQIIDPRDGLVVGLSGNDTLYGHDAVSDEIRGHDGDDTLRGLAGNDQLYGGQGNDDAIGGKGDDTAFGGAGNDVLIGDAGDDELNGEDGVDDLRGGLGEDAYDGGAGIDIANYSAALASVTAALDGSLAGTGEALGDTFLNMEDIRGANIAGTGDTLRGNSGANSVTGNAGNDNLNGRGGADKITGGAGTDTMTGEAGNDQFIYNATTEGGDTITDFTSGADLFRFKGSAFGALPAGSLAANQFQSSTSNVAADSFVRFFYETDTRILRFDADGSLGGSAPVIIATLQAGATVVINDISVF